MKTTLEREEEKIENQEKRKDLFRRQMVMRVDRLKRLLELNVPSSVLCSEVMLVFGSAMGLNSTAMGNAFGERLGRNERDRFGFCSEGYEECEASVRDTDMDNENRICTDCQEKQDKEYGEDDKNI